MSAGVYPKKCLGENPRPGGEAGDCHSWGGNVTGCGRGGGHCLRCLSDLGPLAVHEQPKHGLREHVAGAMKAGEWAPWPGSASSV